jgi:hypothetical protein
MATVAFYTLVARPKLYWPHWAFWLIWPVAKYYHSVAAGSDDKPAAIPHHSAILPDVPRCITSTIIGV